MKLLLENWNRFLTEDDSIFNYIINPDEKTFLTRVPFGEMKNIESSQQKTGFKPQGLWYGCGDEWLKWSRRELPSDYINSMKHIYKIELNYATINEKDTYDRVLKLSTPEEMSDFDYEYGTENYSDRGIDWKRVSIDYGGIEICPYQQDEAKFLNWYYSWDVASGCVWDKGAVKIVEWLSSKQGLTK